MKGKNLGANAMKRVAAGTQLPTPWLFESAKQPDDKNRLLSGNQRIEPTTAWAQKRTYFEGKRKLGANAMKRVAAGDHLPLGF